MAEYILALWTHWVVLMSGVVSVLLLIGLRVGRHVSSRVKEWRDIPDWIFISVALMCLFGAGYLAWQDKTQAYVREHRSVDELTRKLDSMTHPQLKITINQIMFGGRARDTRKGGLLFADSQPLLVTAIVKNLGAPTVVMNYHLKIIAPNKTVECQQQIFPRFLRFESEGIPLILTDADALYNKTMPLPLQTGGAAAGFLFFLARGISEAEVGGAKVILSVRDVTDQETEGTFTFAKAPGRFDYLPGTRNPLLPQ